MWSNLHMVFLLLGLNVFSVLGCGEGDRVAIEGSCKEYLECSGGELVTKSCSWFHDFHPEKLECLWSWNVDCTDKARECEENKLYPDPENCRLYYDCRAGRLIQKFCPLTKIYNKDEEKCSFGFRCNNTECVASERRIVEGDCKSYEECSQGQWAKKACGALQNYDAETQSCRLGSCGQCKTGETREGNACNKYQYCSKGLWRNDHCGLFRRFDSSKKKCVWWFQYTCPTVSSVKFLNAGCEEGAIRGEEDCSKFSTCHSGRWEESSCLEGFLFDTLKNKCVGRGEARCFSCPEDEADPESCGSYYTCIEGKRVKKSCGFLQRWDGVTGTCKMFGAHCFPGERCTGGKRATVDCKAYEECISGRYYKQTCGISRVYDSEKESCAFAWPGHKCSNSFVTPECQDGEKKILSCSRYVECEYGVWRMRSCPEGSTFINGKCVFGNCSVEVIDCLNYMVNGFKLECVPGEVYDVDNGQCVVGSCAIVKPVVNECTEGEKEAVDGSCKKYRECKSGNWVEGSCSHCQNFDREKSVCKFVFDYPCGDPTEEPSTPTSPTSSDSTSPTSPDPTSPTSPAPTSPTTPTQTPPTCKENERKPNTEDCSKYFECKNGKFESASCSIFHKFDSKTLECVIFGAQCA